MISYHRLRELLNYNPDTGDFIWLKRSSQRVPDRTGQIAGCALPSGRRVIKIDGQQYWAYRLAWFYLLASWPIGDLDHIDRDPSNDHWNNLREASSAQQTWNRKQKPSKSGYIGVRRMRGCQTWQAVVGHSNGKKESLGSFKTAQEAAHAYDKKVREIRGDFAVTNFGGYP